MVESVNEANLKEVKTFLSEREDSSQFLINNLREQGPCLTDHLNSGNYKLIRKDSKIITVFCLSRRGNLLVQSDDPQVDAILEACEKEALPLKGFVGDWESVYPVYETFQKRNPAFIAEFKSKEVLFSYELKSSDSKITSDSRVRFLTSSDFAQWSDLHSSYMGELSLPDPMSEEQRKLHFEAQAKDRLWWGLFEDGEMLSRVGLNSKGETIGQVGGVFTPPKHRKRGLAEVTMFHMLKDCLEIHRHQKSILFTRENSPAEKLYESMGYSRIGFFALILGQLK